MDELIDNWFKENKVQYTTEISKKDSNYKIIKIKGANYSLSAPIDKDDRIVIIDYLLSLGLIEFKRR